MSLLPFLAVAILSTAAGLFLRTRVRLTAWIGLGGLAAGLIAAGAIQGGERLVLGGATIATTEYLRLFLVLGCALGLCLGLIGVATGARSDGPAVMLGTLLVAALALALPDTRIAILASTAGGLLGVLVTLAPGARASATAAIREVRAVVIAGTLAIAAAAWIDRPLGDFSVQPEVFGLAYLCFALAVAVRFGVIPFHVWAARLADATPEVSLPVITAWGPAVLAVVALAWVDGSVAALAPELGVERSVVIALAVVTVVLAAIAASIQDDLEHVLGYSIIGDAGIVLLGLAALDPEAWAPTRIWILAFVVSRSAFAAWTAAIRVTYATGRLDDLHGWALRSPPLLATFGLVVVASVGLPGLAAFDAKVDLLELVASGPALAVLLLTTMLPLVYYGRLLAIGVARPSGGSHAEGWLPRWVPVDLNALGTWLGALGRINRVPATIALTLVLALTAVLTSAGGLGLPAAAAGLAPGFDGGPPIVPAEPVDEGSRDAGPEKVGYSAGARTQRSTSRS